MLQLLGGRWERNPAAEQRICGRSRAQYAKSGSDDSLQVFDVRCRTSLPQPPSDPLFYGGGLWRKTRSRIKKSSL